MNERGENELPEVVPKKASGDGRTGQLVSGGFYRMPWGHPVHWPDIPDGRRGRLRGARDVPMGLKAETDIEAIEAWMATKQQRSRNTLLAYRKEITRLLLWAGSRDQALSDLHMEDYLEYRAFLRDPQPASTWIGRGRRFGLSDPRWRPFAGPLSENSIKLAMTLLHDLTQFLSNANYLALNPLALIDRRPPNLADHKGRRQALTQIQWAAIRDAIGGMAQTHPRGEHLRARARWVFTLLYLLGPRISDLRGRFGDFEQESFQGTRLWLWHIVGKGGKAAALPLTDELVTEMIRVRTAFGMNALPRHGDPEPIVPRLHGDRTRPMSRASLHGIVKDVVRDAVDRLVDQGETSEASQLGQASAHWLRHTAASETLDAGADVVTASELLRHGDLRTTQGYLHKDHGQLLAALNLRSAGWENGS